MSRIDYSPLKNFTCLLGRLRTEFTSLITKSTGFGLSDTTFFTSCTVYRFWEVTFHPCNPYLYKLFSSSFHSRLSLVLMPPLSSLLFHLSNTDMHFLSQKVTDKSNFKRIVQTSWGSLQTLQLYRYSKQKFRRSFWYTGSVYNFTLWQKNMLSVEWVKNVRDHIKQGCQRFHLGKKY